MNVTYEHWQNLSNLEHKMQGEEGNLLRHQHRCLAEEWKDGAVPAAVFILRAEHSS